MPSNGNGDHPPTTSVPDLSTSSFDAPQDPLPLASRPERPAAPPSAPEVAQLAPALEDILRSLDESALSFHPDDDEHDDDDQDKDEEDDHVDPKDDPPSPSRRTSTAVKRAKEKMAKQKRVIKSNLKALKGGEVNPTGASPFLVMPNSMRNPPRIVTPDAKTHSYFVCTFRGSAAAHPPSNVHLPCPLPALSPQVPLPPSNDPSQPPPIPSPASLENFSVDLAVGRSPCHAARRVCPHWGSVRSVGSGRLETMDVDVHPCGR